MNTLADQHAGMDDTMLAVRLTPEQASRLVEFANQHDDGGPMPRAGYDKAKDAVVVRSLSMFPATITLHNAADLQKVMSVLYPTTGVTEITDKTRDVATTKTNDANLQTLVNKAEAKADPKPTKAAKKPAAPRKSKVLPKHCFQPVHYKVAARKGTTPEQMIVRQMSAMKRQASAPGTRQYPAGDVHLKSTHAYVHAFYALNHTTFHPSMAEFVDGLFQPLSKTPTTWPAGPEVETQTEA